MPKFLRFIRSLSAVLFLASSLTLCAHAQGGIVNSGSSAPEIDPSLLGGGVALLAGVALLVRSRRKR